MMTFDFDQLQFCRQEWWSVACSIFNIKAGGLAKLQACSMTMSKIIIHKQLKYNNTVDTSVNPMPIDEKPIDILFVSSV